METKRERKHFLPIVLCFLLAAFWKAVAFGLGRFWLYPAVRLKGAFYIFFKKLPHPNPKIYRVNKMSKASLLTEVSVRWRWTRRLSWIESKWFLQIMCFYDLTKEEGSSLKKNVLFVFLLCPWRFLWNLSEDKELGVTQGKGERSAKTERYKRGQPAFQKIPYTAPCLGGIFQLGLLCRSPKHLCLCLSCEIL